MPDQKNVLETKFARWVHRARIYDHIFWIVAMCLTEAYHRRFWYGQLQTEYQGQYIVFFPSTCALLPCPSSTLLIVFYWIIKYILSSRMRSERSRSTLGVWGWGCVAKSCSMLSTVRNRPQPLAWGRSLKLSQQRIHLEWCRKRVNWLVMPHLSWRLQREVSVWVICGVAFLLAFAEAVSVWVILGAVIIIMAFVEEVSVWVILGAGVLLAFAEEVSVWVFVWRLQRKCLCEWSVALQLYRRL